MTMELPTDEELDGMDEAIAEVAQATRPTFRQRIQDVADKATVLEHASQRMHMAALALLAAAKEIKGELEE